MNKKRLGECRGVFWNLSQQESILDRLCDKEMDCVSNYPDSLQGTEQYERSEAAAENLLEALDHVRDAISSLELAMK